MLNGGRKRKIDVSAFASRKSFKHQTMKNRFDTRYYFFSSDAISITASARISLSISSTSVRCLISQCAGVFVIVGSCRLARHEKCNYRFFLPGRMANKRWRSHWAIAVRQNLHVPTMALMVVDFLLSWYRQSPAPFSS